MKKLKFGHDPRKLQAPTVLGQGLKKALEQVVVHEAKEIQLKETVVEQHHHTHTTILKESRDKWARRHAKLSSHRNKSMIDEMSEVLNAQNETLHATRGSIHGVAMEIEKLKVAMQALKEQKPQEFHTVTQKTIQVPVQQNKLVIAGVILSIVLSILALVINK